MIDFKKEEAKVEKKERTVKDMVVTVKDATSNKRNQEIANQVVETLVAYVEPTADGANFAKEVGKHVIEAAPQVLSELGNAISVAEEGYQVYQKYQKGELGFDDAFNFASHTVTALKTAYKRVAESRDILSYIGTPGIEEFDFEEVAEEAAEEIRKAPLVAALNKFKDDLKIEASDEKITKPASDKQEVSSWTFMMK